jgi:hypothetical protein
MVRISDSPRRPEKSGVGRVFLDRMNRIYRMNAAGVGNDAGHDTL